MVSSQCVASLGDLQICDQARARYCRFPSMLDSLCYTQKYIKVNKIILSEIWGGVLLYLVLYRHLYLFKYL